MAPGSGALLSPHEVRIGSVWLNSVFPILVVEFITTPLGLTFTTGIGKRIAGEGWVEEKIPRGRVGGPAPRVLWGSSQKSDLDFGDDNAPRRPPDRRLTSDKDGENRSGTGVDLHFVLAFLRFDQVHGPDRELSVPSRTVESTPACDRRQPIFRASTCPNCKVAKLLSTNALGGPRREY